MSQNEIVITFDDNAIRGAVILLRSMARKLSRTPSFRLVGLYSGKKLQIYRELIDDLGLPFEVHLRYMNQNRYSKLKNAIGSNVQYGLVDYLAEADVKRVLYLDCDIVVNSDVEDILSLDLQGNTLGAVSWCDVASSAESHVATDFGVPLTFPWFNAGVLLFDVRRWTELSCTAAFLRIGEKYASRFSGGDQPIYNFLLVNDIFSIPRKYNRLIYADRKERVEIDDGNYHFLGRPKPWSKLGRWNSCYDLYSSLVGPELRGEISSIKEGGAAVEPREVARCLFRYLIGKLR